jgi:nitroreductase
VDFEQVVRTTGACRRFLPDPVPHDLLLQAVELARFAPQGGNRQGVRVVIVEDPAKRAQLGRWYSEIMIPFRAALTSHADGEPERDARRLTGSMSPAALADAHHLADHFGDVPILVVCVDLSVVDPTDMTLDRTSIVGGASVYPFVQNLMLSLRSLGLGSVITTLLCRREPQIKQLLGIPAQYATAAHLPVGFPERPFPARLSRLPVRDLVFLDRFGTRIAP